MFTSLCLCPEEAAISWSRYATKRRLHQELRTVEIALRNSTVGPKALKDLMGKTSLCSAQLIVAKASNFFPSFFTPPAPAAPSYDLTDSLQSLPNLFLKSLKEILCAKTETRADAPCFSFSEKTT